MKVFLTFKDYFKPILTMSFGMPIAATIRNFNKLAFAMNCLVFYYEIFSGTALEIFKTSVWRPKKYNEKEGGEKNSLHIIGLAIDIMPKSLDSFLLFLRSEIGRYVVKTLGLYYYVGYNKTGIRFFHFQLKKTPHSDPITHQFYTKKYPRKYII